MPSLARPDVDSLRNLSAAIIVDQERIGANARSTVGTATDAYTMLRILFSRIGAPYAGPPFAFSFNRAEGRCPTCPECDGARLNQAALAARIDGYGIAECSGMQIRDLAEFIRGLKDASVGPMLEGLRETRDSMVDIGLGYLSLDRESSTLSGVRRSGSSWSGTSAPR